MDTARRACTGVILAGGAASRYGGIPKGLERVGGIRIIDRVAEALRDATDDLLVIANDPGAEDWLPGVRVARDVRTGVGSLGGMHAALVHAASPVIVVAWDMPFVPASLVRELRTIGERAGGDAVVPESRSSRGLEPLFGYYTQRCRAAIERRLDAGDLRAIGFFYDVYVVKIPVAEVARHGDPATMFANINTPAELAAAEAEAAVTHVQRHGQP